MPLYVAFIDLTKAFDLVSRKGLFRLLEKTGCPPKLRSMMVSFHENTKGTIVYDGSTSEPFPVCSGVKQGCVLAPTLFGIFFSLLQSYAFDSSSDESTCTPDLMGICSTWHVCVPKQRRQRYTSGRCCLRMMQHSLLTQERPTRGWSIALRTPAESLDSQSA